MAAVNSTADTPAEPIPSGKFLKKFKEITMRTERNLKCNFYECLLIRKHSRKRESV
jgi:hypothetical protein